MPTIVAIPVKPVRVEPRNAFLEFKDTRKSGLYTVQTPIYPRSQRGTELRRLRQKTDWSMGHAAKHFSIKVVEWSGIETGSYTLSDAHWKVVEDEFVRVLKAMR